MTRLELRQHILNGLNENTSTPIHFSSSQINDSISEGLEILAEEVDAVKRTAFTPFREGTTFYNIQAIAPDIMAPYRLWVYDTNRRLQATTISELDEYSERWDTINGTPEAWFPVSWDMFGVFPFPAAAGGVLRVDYLAWPRELLDDDDEAELPEASQRAVVDYGIYDGLIKRYDIETAMEFINRFASLFKDVKTKSGIGRKGSSVFWRPRKPQLHFPSEIGNRNLGEDTGI